MIEQVKEAIAEIKLVYGAENVVASEDDQGGAYVIVNNIVLSENYSPTKIWCGFRITYMYPVSQVYPHYVNLELNKTNGSELPQGFTRNVPWYNRNTVQISRTSRGWDPTTDTALIKLEKVLNWIRSQ